MAKRGSEVDECKDTWYPFSWYCPNCGTQLIGFENAEDMIKVECQHRLSDDGARLRESSLQEET